MSSSMHASGLSSTGFGTGPAVSIWPELPGRLRDSSGSPFTPASRPDLLHRVFDSLREEHVRYCLLRGFNKLSSRRPAGDFDLLVDPADAQLFRHILALHGFLAFGKPARSSCLYVAYDQAGDSWVKLDVTGEICCQTRWFTLPTHLAESCLRGRRWRPPVFIPAPEDEFIALFLHCLIEKRRFKSSHAERLSALQIEISGHRNSRTRLAEYLEILLTSSGATAFEHAAKNGDWSSLTRIRSAVTRKLFGINRRESCTITFRRIPAGLKWLLSEGDSRQSVLMAIRSNDRRFGCELKTHLAGCAHAAVRLIETGEPKSVWARLPGRQIVRNLRLRYDRFRGRVLIVAGSGNGTPIRHDLLISDEPPASASTLSSTVRNNQRVSPSHVLFVHAKGSPEEVRRAVMYGIWLHLKTRYLTSGKGTGGNLKAC